MRNQPTKNQAKVKVDAKEDRFDCDFGFWFQSRLAHMSNSFFFLFWGGETDNADQLINYIFGNY